ncbi:pseudouridine synthase [Neofamilia massiliensis]|uniref:pseudouridine synthase n=1 Tax=Neofamilia massiliensis TaxID=1673724 RepID=UPI0006BB8780|nr:pseudouridine synthase [Neofamilia massiliensis]
MRLQKYLAHCGVASRRQAELIIAKSRVSVNDEIVTDPARDVSDQDLVKVDGKLIKLNKTYKYYLLNKPLGVVSTASDEKGRLNVIDLINSDKRLYPIGRLDMDTTGIILITNDGKLTQILTHPKYELSKTYIAKVKGRPNKTSLNKLRSGLYIDGRKTKEAQVRILNTYPNETLVEISIQEGRNRQIRKMFDAIDHPVVSLKRIKIGEIEIGGLMVGDYRELNKEEMDYINQIKNNNEI